MKGRLTSSFFLMAVILFVLALAGCKAVEMTESEDDSTSDVAPMNMFSGKSQAAEPASTEVEFAEPETTQLLGAEESERVAVSLAGELNGRAVEEKILSVYQRSVKVGAHAKYLKRYEMGQRVFILSPILAKCSHFDAFVDCTDGLGKLLAELSQVCEIAEIDTVSGGFFVDFRGSGNWVYKTGVTATTALVVRVSSCGEKKTE